MQTKLFEDLMEKLWEKIILSYNLGFSLFHLFDFYNKTKLGF